MKTCKNKRSKACNITPKVKAAVWERDHHRCILCGNAAAMPNAHYIPRSQGGLGVEENIATLCCNCHRQYDQTTQRKALGEEIRDYLKSKYKDWDESKLVYRRDL